MNIESSGVITRGGWGQNTSGVNSERERGCTATPAHPPATRFSVCCDPTCEMMRGTSNPTPTPAQNRGTPMRVRLSMGAVDHGTVNSRNTITEITGWKYAGTAACFLLFRALFFTRQCLTLFRGHSSMKIGHSNFLNQVRHCPLKMQSPRDALTYYTHSCNRHILYTRHVSKSHSLVNID